MCLFPTYIKPKYRDLRPGSPTLVVSKCGRCDECRKERATDFAVRAYYDWLYCKEKGGFCFFDTLTLDNKFVKTKHVNGKRVTVFDDNMIKIFKKKFELKAMHAYAKKHGISYTAKNRDTILKPLIRHDFKLLIASEFGGETHRVHYHPLIFNALDFDAQEVEAILMHSWTFNSNRQQVEGIKIPCEYMIGGVEDIPASEKVVRDFGALFYVSNYLNKDDDYDMYIQEELGEKWSQMSQAEKNEFIPRHFLPQGFGIHLLDYYNVDYLVDIGKVKIPDKVHGERFVSVPKYYIRKFCYDTFKSIVIDDKNTTKDTISLRVDYQKRLNERGVRWYSGLLLNSIQKRVEALDKLLNFTPTEYVDLNIPVQDDFRFYIENRELCAAYDLLMRNRRNHLGIEEDFTFSEVIEQINVVSSNFYTDDFAMLEDSDIFAFEKYEDVLHKFDVIRKYRTKLFLNSEGYKILKAAERRRRIEVSCKPIKKQCNKLKFLKDIRL